MVNIDAITQSTTEIQINGEVINVYDVTYSMAKRVREFQDYLRDPSATPDESENRQADLIIDFLNNNKNNKKFTKKDLDKLSFMSIKTLYNLMVELINKTELDPNLESHCQAEK
ncbi:hypothetical protein [Clostridium perfringens]|uniref:hypothetical protein n=1 Tax=Clostridium perfringens TaxID=1502 RepID=UPI001ABA461A|nr:hypothetical protein [Clostridium perfringens]MBO3420208.1 hypothetical protein [Clostridium perfringens]